jgi:heme oxygenase
MTIDVARGDSQPVSSRSSSRARAQAVPNFAFLERLKYETAAEHAAIESATGILDPGLGLEGYRAYLERSFGFYRIVEPQLRELGAWDALKLDATEREKLPFLAEDIVLLGNTEPASIRGCDAGPAFASTAEAVGGAYVLEGSTLGGRVISRLIQSSFGPAAPRSFLECYGTETGKQWQLFRAALAHFATSASIEDQIIVGARTTFETFTRWLKP